MGFRSQQLLNMEVSAMACSSDQTISSYKQIRRNPNRNMHTTVPLPSESFSPENLILNLHRRGLLMGPPPYLSSSLSFSLGNQYPQQKPPLLPLPTNRPLPRNTGISCPPTNRKTNKVRNQDLTVEKPKPSPGKTSKKKGSRSMKQEVPKPSDLPKEVTRVENPYDSFEERDEILMPSIFYLSPPPSSLPLPKFSLRPKISCNAGAGGVDAGATDDLRRLLRLL